MTIMTISLTITMLSLLVIIMDIASFGACDSNITWEDNTCDFSIMDDVMEIEYFGMTLDDHAEEHMENIMALVVLDRLSARADLITHKIIMDRAATPTIVPAPARDTVANTWDALGYQA